MIQKECDTYEDRTTHNRRQWADEEDSAVMIRTEYTCTECGAVSITYNEFTTNE